MRKILRVILHCSATPDFAEKDQNIDKFGLSDIDLWHRNKGWNGCGYHRVIRRTGKIEIGRQYSEIGAHCFGQNNNSIGICYIGTSKPTKKQLVAICSLYKSIYQNFGIAWDNWYCHNQFDSGKTCPGFSIEILRYILFLYDHYQII
jgi:N-acetylmuramoyl-L-alanine amidase